MNKQPYNRIYMMLKMDTVSLCLFIIMLLSVMTSCNSKQSNKDVDSEKVNVSSDINYDEIANLEIFFDSIQQKHGIPIWHTNDSAKCVGNVYKSIREINKYRRGEVKYYPQQLVKDCLNSLVWNQSILENHGAEINRDFFDNYLYLISYYCPDISYLVDMRTDDYMAGIKCFRTYSIPPFESYLFTKHGKGFKVTQIGSEQEILSIYKLIDTEGDLYYLCTNNENVAIYFGQYLYMVNAENDVILVKQNTIFPDKIKEEDKIYFNKDKLTWTVCKEDKHGKLIPLEDSFMKLVLDGENSEFILSTNMDNDGI